MGITLDFDIIVFINYTSEMLNILNIVFKLQDWISITLI